MDKNEGRLQEREPNLQAISTQGTRPQLEPQCLSSDPGKMTPPWPFLSLAGGLQVRLGLASSEAPFLGGGMGWFTAGSGEAASPPPVYLGTSVPGLMSTLSIKGVSLWTLQGKVSPFRDRPEARAQSDSVTGQGNMAEMWSGFRLGLWDTKVHVIP